MLLPDSRCVLSAENAADAVLAGRLLSATDLEALAACPTADLTRAAGRVRDAGSTEIVTYSRKVFLPVTHLCRNVCHYCTFAKAPRSLRAPYMSEQEVLAVARRGEAAGCNEALLTLGEKPELRYAAAAEWLAAHGFATTTHYVAHLAGAVLKETGLLPHVNCGTLTADEIQLLRPVCASIGIMLESASDRLCGVGMPHHGSPDKLPAARLRTLRAAGECRLPVTSGILVGIGETVGERIQALLALRDLHHEYGQLQEVIVQPFRAKAGTRMANWPEPSVDDVVRTVALARLALGAAMSIQTPPNLTPTMLGALVDAGINDWGGVSPVTPDHVNPEAPWPHLATLAHQTAAAGRQLVQRLPVYPPYLRDGATWLDPRVFPAARRASDADGMAREHSWQAGAGMPVPRHEIARPATNFTASSRISAELRGLVAAATRGASIAVGGVTRLFEARGEEVAYICRAADELRRTVVGDEVSYVVTRNINYTNVCSYSCRFCAFSKGKTHDDLRGKPYDLSLDEIRRRTLEAWERGASEVCIQGGIHPAYSGHTYAEICRAVKAVAPEMHIHAFSPLEISMGAATLGMPVDAYLQMLKDCGLGTLPGTAAEILDDEIRALLCPGKLSTAEWLNVIETAHRIGLKSTSTIMFGHVERPVHWARHLLALRALQQRTGGITEFVPLPFVAREAPLYRKGLSRPGPTFREVLLMHSVARLVLHPLITNIQASWPKLGRDGVLACMNAGVNDVGGTLMNESISRAAGGVHGEEAPPEALERWIRDAGRIPVQRTTTYRKVDPRRREASLNARKLSQAVNTPLARLRRETTSGLQRLNRE
ncbi:MAG: 5-amino-6-(D-ribitylamino)uracil--L-tyrosine 4-hydroxyphenyl transferase CofH [Burkholderiaceae bacterium]|nr:5-amino-6-(D-ribitylamino)uracil--L-tyrosine 4-hydroxyphenyl transferase CofH [Burkholderiaceae bacterium]